MKILFPSDQALAQAQQWLAKNGMQRHYCSLLCDIHARWLHHSEVALSLSQLSTIYGVTRKTAGKLLQVLATECDYKLERVRDDAGADIGYQMYFS